MSLESAHRYFAYPALFGVLGGMIGGLLFALTGTLMGLLTGGSSEPVTFETVLTGAAIYILATVGGVAFGQPAGVLTGLAAASCRQLRLTPGAYVLSCTVFGGACAALQSEFLTFRRAEDFTPWAMAAAGAGAAFVCAWLTRPGRTS